MRLKLSQKPQKRKRKPKNKNKKPNLIKTLIIIFLGLLIFSGLRGLYLESISQPTNQTIGLSELVKQINQDKVSKITVKENELLINLKDQTKQKAYKENEASLTQTLKNYGVDQEKLRNIELKIDQPSAWEMWAGILVPIILPFLFIGLFIWFMFRGAKKANFQAMNFGRSIARMIKPEKKNKNGIKFKDVAGLKEPKQELQEVVQFLKNPQKFTNLGASIPKGVLLVGPPGTGKTMLAKAVANEAHVPFFNVSGSEFIEMFVGVGSARTRDLFQQAKKNAPSIIFIDELDAIGRRRGRGFGGTHEEREQTLNQILVEMDGFEPNEQVIVIAATNRPDVVDPALLRPGRFDRRITLDLPDIREREAILKIHSRKKPLAKNVDLRNIAERTPGFSGADLANLINEAAILSARKNKKQISTAQLRTAIEKVLLGPERKSKIITDREKKISAYHEAGHALVAHFTKHTDPVQKVSIISRGRAGGYTLKMPIEDRNLQSKKQLQDELSVLLAGRLSEKIIFNDITTGAVNDLQKATHLAKKMIAEYGMSEKLGPIQYYSVDDGDDDDWQKTFGYRIPTKREFSEKTAKIIDQEIKKTITRAQEQALDIINNKKDKLKLIAQKLIEQETIEKEEFAQLMKE